jgi:hypothetical protein
VPLGPYFSPLGLAVPFGQVRGEEEVIHGT